MRILILLLILSLKSSLFLAQEPAQHSHTNHFYISGGTHLNFWAHVGTRNIPYNIHLDGLFKSRFSLGLGYSFEEYKEFPYFFYWEPRWGDKRHNVRLRYCYYYQDPTKIFSQYIGCSLGVSFWDSFHPDNREFLLPTTQFLYGMKVQFNPYIFANLEFGLGSPYMIRAAIGTSF